MSSHCPVHQVKIKTYVIALYSLHKSTLLFFKNNHILKIKLDKSDILLYKELYTIVFYKILSGPYQGSMVVQDTTCCQLYQIPVLRLSQYYIDTVGVHLVNAQLNYAYLSIHHNTSGSSPG